MSVLMLPMSPEHFMVLWKNGENLLNLIENHDIYPCDFIFDYAHSPHVALSKSHFYRSFL